MIEQEYGMLKIALLIDYDNFNQNDHISVLIDELKELGTILIKDAFYSNFNDKNIRDKFITHGLNPVMEIPYSDHKNAVDIKMTISIMDLLKNAEYIDCFCVATSDLDFTPVIKRLKRENKVVIGSSGNPKTKNEYKKLFDRFINVDQIIESKKNLEQNAFEKQRYQEILDIVKTFKKIIDDYGEDGTMNFSNFMQFLYREMPDFNPKNYGAKNSKPSSFVIDSLNTFFEYDYTTKIIKVLN